MQNNGQDQAPHTFRSVGAAAIGVVAKLEAQRHRITAPGLYQMPPEVYHADPCPNPSLSRSIAKLIITRSPRHAWFAHPRLNPVPTEENSRKLDAGAIAHALLFGAGATIEIIQADDYRSKAAQQARDQARAAGKLPALVGDHENARQMVEVARAALRGASAELRALVDRDDVKSEMVIAWREEGAWCRCMIDRCDAGLRTIVDYKTTTNAHPATAARRIWDNDYHLQPPWYTRGLDAIDPQGIGRRQFYFLFQEDEPPYACSLMQLAGDAWAMGERQCAAALALWTRCIETNTWPEYGPGVHRADMPAWKENGWLSREEQEPALAPRGELTVLDAG